MKYDEGGKLIWHKVLNIFFGPDAFVLSEDENLLIGTGGSTTSGNCNVFQLKASDGTIQNE